MSLTRHEIEEDQLGLLLKAIKNVNSENYIVGVDISGDEDVSVPDYLSAFFLTAKEDMGLGVTIHAGETGNVENIEWAINKCGAKRIGHGSAAIKSEKVLNLIKEKDICIEVCLISNLRTGYCSTIENHPLKTFLEWEIPFVLCTDNPSVHGASLSDEYWLFLKQYNRLDVLNDMNNRNKRYAFG